MSVESCSTAVGEEGRAGSEVNTVWEKVARRESVREDKCKETTVSGGRTDVEEGVVWNEPDEGDFPENTGGGKREDGEERGERCVGEIMGSTEITG